MHKRPINASDVAGIKRSRFSDIETRSFAEDSACFCSPRLRAAFGRIMFYFWLHPGDFVQKVGKHPK